MASDGVPTCLLRCPTEVKHFPGPSNDVKQTCNIVA